MKRTLDPEQTHPERKPRKSASPQQLQPQRRTFQDMKRQKQSLESGAEEVP